MELRFTVDTLPAAASACWQQAGQRRVLAFYGPMGAGKTTFIQALCRHLGVTSPVSSPTFSIINQYDSPAGPVLHMDLYRLRDEEEAIRAGVEDSLYSGHICLVEWPERAPGIFPHNTVVISLQVIDPQTRLLNIGDK